MRPHLREDSLDGNLVLRCQFTPLGQTLPCPSLWDDEASRRQDRVENPFSCHLQQQTQPLCTVTNSWNQGPTLEICIFLVYSILSLFWVFLSAILIDFLFTEEVNSRGGYFLGGLLVHVLLLNQIAGEIAHDTHLILAVTVHTASPELSSCVFSH